MRKVLAFPFALAALALAMAAVTLIVVAYLFSAGADNITGTTRRHPGKLEA